MSLKVLINKLHNKTDTTRKTQFTYESVSVGKFSITHDLLPMDLYL